MANDKTILLLTDFTKRAERAAEMALELAINNKADILIYNSVVSIEASVITGQRRSSDKEIAAMNRKSEDNLTYLSDHLNSKLPTGTPVEIIIKCQNGTGPVVETISELVAENNIWMVVMGNHVDKEIASLYFDSNVPSVMNYCGCPLLLVP